MNTPVTDWRGKCVWIIGASSGIGAETAKQLSAQGAKLALSARRKALLEQVAASCHDALVLEADITDNTTLQQANAELLAQWGGYDLVLIVSGTYHPMRAETFDLQAAQQTIDVNLKGVYQVLDNVLPVFLKQQSGGIGVVGSVAGLSGLPDALAYGPSKAALINLCESLYFDLHAKGVAVYMINPGFVDTPMTSVNKFTMPALMTPPQAATALIRGIMNGEFHIHFPRRFTNWLRFARLLPYRGYFYLIHKFTGL